MKGVPTADPTAMCGIVAHRLRAQGIPYTANDCIANALDPGDLAWIEEGVIKACQQLLDALVIDTENDHNTRETARRLAKMFVRETFRGRYQHGPAITSFPNAKKLDELYTLGPIAVRSTCSHHFAPITGSVWVGVVPGKSVIGISKFSRVADWIMSRPQIQEEAVVQLADTLESLIEPRGVAVVLKATHHCMTMRGVKEHDTSMVTSVMRGLFREAHGTRSEFFNIIQGQGYAA